MRRSRHAFGLKELVWVETREHESINIVRAVRRPHGGRPGAAGDPVVKPLLRGGEGILRPLWQAMVRLPGGYNPNQVAAQILAQCSGQLGDKRETDLLVIRSRRAENSQPANRPTPPQKRHQ